LAVGKLAEQWFVAADWRRVDLMLQQDMRVVTDTMEQHQDKVKCR